MIKRFSYEFFVVVLTGALAVGPAFANPLLGIGVVGAGGSVSSGGGAAAFSPSDVSGLKLWLKSDAGVSTSAIGSAKFVASEQEYLSIANNATLQTGDIDFTIAFRFKYTSRVASDLLAKLGSSGQWEWLIRDDGSGLAFYVSSNGSGLTSVKDGSTDLATTGVWHTAFCWHDSVANTINVQIDGNTVASSSYSSGVFVGTSELRLGKSEFSGNPIDAQLDSVGFWKRTLTSSERTFLHNSNSGQSYATIGVAATNGSALKTSLVSWWDLDEASGTRYDKHGTNNLTDNNTVMGAIDGVTSATSDQVITSWADQSGNGYDFTQATAGAYPVKVDSAINSLPVIQTDGVSQFLQNASMLGLTDGQARTFVIVAKIASAGARTPIFFQGVSGSGSDFIGLEANTSSTAGSRWGLFCTEAALDSNAATDTNYHVFYIAASTMATSNSITSNVTYRIDKVTKTLSVNIGGSNFVSLSGANATAIGRYPGVGTFGASSVAEVIVLDNAPNSTVRDNLENYASTRYGL